MIKTPTGIDDEEYHIQGFYPAAPYASNNFFLSGPYSFHRDRLFVKDNRSNFDFVRTFITNRITLLYSGPPTLYCSSVSIQRFGLFPSIKVIFAFLYPPGKLCNWLTSL